MYATSKSSHTPKVHNIVLDGPIIVHLLKLIGADTFEDDAQQVLFRYVTSQCLLELKSYGVKVLLLVTGSSVAVNANTPSN